MTPDSGDTSPSHTGRTRKRRTNEAGDGDGHRDRPDRHETEIESAEAARRRKEAAGRMPRPDD